MLQHDDTAVLPASGGHGLQPASPAPHRRKRRWDPVVLAIVSGFAVLVLLGVTTSSLAYPLVRQDPAHPLTTTWGDPRGIRSDEFAVDTPLLFGLSATGADSIESPLAAPSDLVVGIPTSGDVFASVVHFDGALMRLGGLLPETSLFAARWWFPWLLLLLALPPWLRRVGATAPMAWLATVLVAAAPATAWWSGHPVRILGFAAAGCTLGMAATRAFGDRRWLVGAGQSVLAGLLLSRLATWYVPWSVTLAAPVVLATLCWLLADRERRRAGIQAIAVATGVALVLLVGLYWQNRAGLAAGLDTVYPGQRRSGGAASPLAQLFGAPGNAYFQLGNDVTSLNVSELSSGYAVCAIWAAVLFTAAPHVAAAARARAAAGSSLRWSPRLPADPNAWVIGVLAAATIVELLWATVSFGLIGEAVPVLNRVPAKRAAETVGYTAALLVCLMLSRRGRATGLRVPLLAAGGSAAVTAYAVSHLRTYAPGIGAPLIVGVSVAVFVVVLTVTWQPDRWRWTALAACLAGAAVVAANPLQIGAGDFRDSVSAQQMLARGETARADGTYWATDDPYLDTLLIATGVPTLSGNQFAGPDRAAWARLDPRGEYEENWNRGGASVQMVWAPGPLVVYNNNDDEIDVQVDPCDLSRRGFPLGHIISGRPLDDACLAPDGELQWQGTTRYIYRIGQ